MASSINRTLFVPAAHDEYDFDDDSIDFDDDRDFDEQESDEDTEDASETDMVKQEEEYSELKEQVYQDKLANLKKQLQQLKDGCHPDYNRRLKKMEQAYRDRLRLADLLKDYEIACVEREYSKEKKSAEIELEEKIIELKESLILEFEEKKRMIENERSIIELTGVCFPDCMEVKPVTTRKLRRRPNDPLPMPEKRRKTSPTQLNYLLDENAVMEDLRIINKGKPFSLVKKQSSSDLPITATDGPPFDVKIEDGKLCYEKRWFHRSQTVYVESKDTGKFAGVISSVGVTEIWVRKTSDNSKIRVYVSQLQKGKYTIRRRST